jgi:S1-C subfamily serine protease
MNETSGPAPNLLVARLQRLRAGVRSAAPFATGVLATLFALWLYNSLFPPPPPLSAKDVNNSIAQAMASATPAPAYSTLVYQVIQPSLVLIQTTAQDQNAETEHGLGSGVVIDNAGEILTSLHVVKNALNIQVFFADGTKAGAKIVAEQPEHDIAVLQPFILPQLIVPAVLGNPGAMRVGDEAYVVGNPFGLYSSMSAGVISGFDRTFHLTESKTDLQGLIQVDAAINPGNSGGPLLDRGGHVIGIVTGIINPTEDSFFVGIGFAVPINVAVGALGGAPPY